MQSLKISVAYDLYRHEYNDGLSSFLHLMCPCLLPCRISIFHCLGWMRMREDRAEVTGCRAPISRRGPGNKASSFCSRPCCASAKAMLKSCHGPKAKEHVRWAAAERTSTAVWSGSAPSQSLVFNVTLNSEHIQPYLFIYIIWMLWLVYTCENAIYISHVPFPTIHQSH